MNSLINSEFSRLCFFKFTARQSLSFSQNYFFSSEIQLPNLKLNRAGNILINPRNPRSEKQCIQKIFLWLSLFCVYGNGLEMAECLKQNLRGERPFSPAIRFKRFRIGEKRLGHRFFFDFFKVSMDVLTNSACKMRAKWNICN